MRFARQPLERRESKFANDSAGLRSKLRHATMGSIFPGLPITCTRGQKAFGFGLLRDSLALTNRQVSR
jgi:hypothetical protein